MLNQEFFEILEYKICDVLGSIDDVNIKWLWCDGVLPSEPDSHYSQKYINDNRQTDLKAYVGKSGEDNYALTLKFGKKALSRYARNSDIIQCIPEADPETWFHIDVDKRKIVIQLD